MNSIIHSFVNVGYHANLPLYFYIICQLFWVEVAIGVKIWNGGANVPGDWYDDLKWDPEGKNER
jgi:hypothetical protein